MKLHRPCVVTVILTLTILLTACLAPKTVIVTQEVTKEVEVTRIVVKEDTGAEQKPAPTFTRYPTYTPYPTYTVPPAPTQTPTPTPTSGPTSTPTQEPTSTPTVSPTPEPTRPPVTPTPVMTPTPAMVQIEDRDPGPPLTIIVSTARLLDNSVYLVSGLLRNDTAETFEAIGIDATFFDDEGFRHGPMHAEVPFLLLGPGEECPFYVELAARRLLSFQLHPNGRPSERRSAPVALSNLGLSYGSDSVRITGKATNVNEFKAKNVVVAGVLLDASGHIVSLGSTYVLEEDISPNGAVWFDMRIALVPFYRYRLYAQAERDWE